MTGTLPTQPSGRANPPSAPTLHRFRALWALAAILVLTPALWLLLRPYVTERTFSFTLVTANAGPQWSLNWTRASDGRENGVWLDLAAHVRKWETETLEIRLDGRATDAARPYEFWLYQVRPLDSELATIDLKAAIASGASDDVVGAWEPFEGGPGIAYFATEPGLLRLRVPAGGVSISTARRPGGGVVEFAYADDCQSIDLSATQGNGQTVTLARRTIPAGETLTVQTAIPNYRLGALELRWFDSPGVRVDFADGEIVTRVFGIRAATQSVAAQASPEADRASPAGQLVLERSPRLERAEHWFGIIAVLSTLLTLTVFIWLLSRGPLSIARRACTPFALALIAVIAIRMWMAVWAIFIISPDGAGYIRHAAEFLNTGTLTHIREVWLPGYAAFLAPFIWLFGDFGAAVAIAQQMLGVGSAILVYGLARTALPAAPSAAAMLLFGLDPEPLVYERWILTESLATFLLLLSCYLAVRPQTRPARPTWRRGLAWGVAAGVVIACASYVRANLQTLALLWPAMLLLAGWKRRALAPAAVQGVALAGAAAACLWPWCAMNYQRYGLPTLSPARNYSHLVNLWNHGELDTNQTAVVSRDGWQQLRADASRGDMNPTHVFDAISGSTTRAARSPEAWMDGEARARIAVEESCARHAIGSLRPRIVAFIVQMGLWTKFDGVKPNETEWEASGFRGRPIQPTNTMLSADQQAASAGDPVLAELVRRMQRSTAPLIGNPHARWFDEYFGAWRLLRPLLGVLVLVGLTVALLRREWLVAGMGLIVLANAVALAFLVASAIDRYRVPFDGLVAVVAVYGICALRRRPETGIVAGPHASG